MHIGRNNILKAFIPISILLSLISVPVYAISIQDPGMISYISTTDVKVSTPYLDFSLWILITLLGLGFLILSNVVNDNQSPKLWAIIAPLFLGPSAWFTLMLRESSVAYIFNTTSIVDNVSSYELHTNVINVITHPEWLCVVMSIILVISIVNIWMQISKKPIEKSKKEEVVGKGEF